MGQDINGKEVAEKLGEEIKRDVDALKAKGITPRLTVIMIGSNPASQIYVKNKKKAAAKLGIDGVLEEYPSGTSEEALLERITELNEDSANHGILVQLPLPKEIDSNKILLHIDPLKDVDGFHPVNLGKLLTNQPCLKSCTPAGIMRLIESTGIDISGKDAVIVGRSNIVGKPVALMLLHKNATVTICHSKTSFLPEKARDADILIAAIGRPEFVKGDWIKKGAVVIDVGINRTEDGKIKGDVEYASAKERAAFITPVPGGVGPMTIAMLMKNTLEAAKCLSEHHYMGNI